MFGGDFMKKIRQMQDALGNIQEELEKIRVEFSAGGDMVTVVLNGKKELVGIKLSPEVVNPDDVEMLEDLIVAAFRGAQQKVDEKIKEKMAEIVAGLGINPEDLPGGLPV